MNESQVLSSTSYNFPGQTAFYKGKVRDVYTIGDELLVMVVSDRISAFDVILPRAIPYKGQVLNQLASRNMHAAKEIVPNWILDVPDPNVTIGKRCEPLKVEMVIRGYLAGHAWRTYASGKRELCGVQLPDGLKENDRLPEPIITPTTKASEGHDEDISREDIIKSGIVAEKDYQALEDHTRNLFESGSSIAESRGLILVDTKYEFGKYKGEITLIDEIHTPDSSRYFYAEGYAERQNAGEPQRQLSKEFLRQWLISNGFQGKEGQSVPVMDDEIVNMVSGRYIELYEKLTGESFQKADTANINERVQRNITAALSTLMV
jgi:phosphoribosylaminoimidazole-succinocarboxamide synthase